MMTFQFVKAVNDGDTGLEKVLIRLISLSNLPLTIMTWLFYLIRRKTMLDFFRDWNNFEERALIRYVNSGKIIGRVCIAIYALYYTLTAFFFVTFSVVFLTVDPEPQDTDVVGNLIVHNNSYLTNAPLTYVMPYITLWTVLMALILMCVIDIVPVMVYYHAAKAIRSMEIEIEAIADAQPSNSIKFEANIQRIWCNFESLRLMVNRADDLFGPLVIPQQGLAFFVICGSVFTLISSLSKAPEDATQGLSIFAFSLIFYPSRLFFSIGFMTKVHSSSGQLLSTVARISANSWRSMGQDERGLLRSFLSRIQHVKLAAYPSGYYRITKSILLTMLSLIISYTIILLQSK